MRLWILSDLHCEFGNILPPAAPVCDAVICAGDLDVPLTRSVRRAATLAELASAPVILVPGHHEFYHVRIETELKTARTTCDYRVHLLDEDVVEISGVRFLGTTLWTDYDLFGDDQRSTTMMAARRFLADHQFIEQEEGDGSRRFAPDDALMRHRASRAWLEARLSEAFDGPTVVVTHQGCAPGSVSEKYRDDLLSAAFVSDLTDLIRKYTPNLWIHGHTHDGADYTIGSTRVIVNPRGYERFGVIENHVWDEYLVVEI